MSRSTPDPGTGSVIAANENAAERQRRTSKKRRRGARVDDEGDVQGDFANETLKAGARAFCRLGTVFTAIYHIVTEAVIWDLARDTRLRGQPSPLGPGSRPSVEELKAVESSM